MSDITNDATKSFELGVFTFADLSGAATPETSDHRRKPARRADPSTRPRHLLPPLPRLRRQHELLHLDRFLGQVDLGGLPRHHVLQSIELLGTEVSAIARRRLG